METSEIDNPVSCALELITGQYFVVSGVPNLLIETTENQKNLAEW